MDGLLDGEELDRRTEAAAPALEVGGEPVGCVTLRADARVPGVEHDGDARLVRERPERVVGRVERRAPTGGGDRGGRQHDDQPRAPVECPGELLDGPGGIGERQVGRCVDPVLVGEAPVLLDPPVERPEGLGHGHGVVAQQRLVDHAERREHPARGDALLVHRRQPGVPVAVGGPDRLAVAQQGDRVDLVGVAPEVRRQDPGLGHGVERGVGHGAADPAADHVVHAPTDLAPLDAAGPVGGVEVAGEGVERLVVVVVGIVHRMGQVRSGARRAAIVGHGHDLSLEPVPPPGRIAAPRRRRAGW